MIEYTRNILAGQYHASLSMLDACIRKCPPEQWDGKIAKYPFWLVVYHTLCFLDLYLTPNEASFEFRECHPKGWSEFNDEYPSRRFSQDEMAAYAVICHQKVDTSLASETAESLQGESGFPRLRFSRGELHLYNIRHVQHHTGQLTAFLRRFDVHVDWVKTGKGEGNRD